MDRKRSPLENLARCFRAQDKESHVLLREWFDHLTAHVQDSYAGIPPELNTPLQPSRHARAMLLDSISMARARNEEVSHYARGRAAIMVLIELAGNLVAADTTHHRTVELQTEYLLAYREAELLLFEWGADYKLDIPPAS